MTILSYSEKEIALLQLDYQEKILNFEIVKLEVSLSPESSQGEWRMLDELRSLRNALRATRREIELHHVNKPTWWDLIKVKLYKWSVSERFQ